MSLKYSLTFLVLSIACVLAGLLSWDFFGWCAIVFFYSAFSFILLAVAYAGVGPRMLIKRPTGRRPAWAWLLLAPYFLLNAVSFSLYRMLSRGPAYVEVAPNLFFGRRLTVRETKGTPWVSVLDLAGEFSEVRPLRELPGYQSLPVLDATAPTERQLRDVNAWLARAVESGPVYVHCALGHGRSACVVLAYLLSAGLVGSIAEGVRRLRTLRSGVKLHAAQRRHLRVFERGQQNPSGHIEHK